MVLDSLKFQEREKVEFKTGISKTYTIAFKRPLFADAVIKRAPVPVRPNPHLHSYVDTPPIQISSLPYTRQIEPRNGPYPSLLL